MSISALPERDGLRARNKAKRRDAVLEAALTALDGPDASSVTTERIAELAEVSVATVYNLVGTREELLMALVDRLIGDLVESISTVPAADDPAGDMRQLIEGSVEVLTGRPRAYRQVVLQLTAAASVDLHTKLNPSSVAAAAFRSAQRRGTVREDLDPDALAMQVYLSYNGALLRWAAGALSDAGFMAAALHGLSAVLAASATTKARSGALAELRTHGAELGRQSRAGPRRA